jgi:uncharacterized membrane protein
VAPVLIALTDALGRSPVAARIGSELERVASPLRRVPRLADVLRGTAFGHPLHPFLVTAPIGAWTSASVLDLTGRDPGTARALTGAGVLMALPTVLTGATDWLGTEGDARGVGAVHASVNLAATAVYAASWWVRPKRPSLGVVLGVAGAGLASAAGWLGGHLTYGLRVGVRPAVPPAPVDNCAEAT